MRKKWLTLLLAAVMLLGCLAGCGDKSQNSGQSGSKNNGSNNSTESEYAYKATYGTMQIPDDVTISYIQSSFVVDNVLYFAASVVTGTETVTDETTGDSWENQLQEMRLYKMNLDGSDCQQLTGFTSTNVEDGWSNVSTLACASDGSIWVAETVQISQYDLPENFDETTMSKYDYWVSDTNYVHMTQLDASGALISTMDLTVGDSTNSYISDVKIDGNDYIYGNANDMVYIWKMDGTLVASVENPNYLSLMQWTDGSIGLQGYDSETSGYIYQKIDAATGTLSENKIKMPYNAYNCYAGFGDYDFVYTTNSDSWYGYISATDTSEKLFSWTDCDVNGYDLNSYYFLSDGNVFALEQEYSEDYSTTTFSTVMLTRVKSSELPQKTEVTLACMWLGYDLRAKVVEFNKAHDDVRIVIKDYSEYNTEDDYSAGQTKLNTEIISGVAPDIIYDSGNSLPISQYAAKGVLQDLWPMIENDSALGRENVMSEVFDAMSIDGKLYGVTDSFYIQTVAGKASMLDGMTSWTLDDLMRVKEEAGDDVSIFGQYDTKSSVLSECVSRAIDTFINWEKGTCSFDSQEFIDILKLANSFPTEFNWNDYDYDTDYESDYSRIQSGKQLLMPYNIANFETFTYVEAMFNNDASFIGYPSTTGNGNVFGTASTISICSSCKNTEAAWSFVREYLLEENQTSEYMYQFPTNRNSFNAMVKAAMTPEYTTDPDTGEQVESPKSEYWMDENTTLDIMAMTQEQYDQFMELYNSCTTVYSYNQSILKIISDEADAYFNGEKTAEQTASLIQSRVSLYVAEQG